MNKTNVVWQETISSILSNPDYIASPRGMEVKEVLSRTYKVQMPAYLDLEDRKVNLAFMFAEAAWIISGSNRLSDITPYMKIYENFSDDGVFLRGAYGPKVIDQFGYVVDSLVKDLDTRQAVMTTWRERPGESKDIPCTVSMQFIIRDGKLNMITTMRSHDIILGATYDMFTFSMIANSVRLLLCARGVEVNLGELYVTSGSLHIYERHYEQAKTWISSTVIDSTIKNHVDNIMTAHTYEQLITNLQEEAEACK